MLGELPLLVADPASYLAGERMVLAHLFNEYRSVAERYLNRAGEGGIRAETLRQIAAGLNQNAEYLEKLFAQLPESQVQLSQYMPTLGTDLFGGLRRDWSGAAEAEAELQVIEQAVANVLAEQSPEKILVLGAGTGRLLADLASRFPKVVGIELSLAVAATWVQLQQQGTLEAFHLYSGNYRRAAEEYERFVARRSLSVGRPTYVVADAGQTPFPNACFDAVVSPYFTDLMPLSRLLPEVYRVLRPGGRMIHFGTLGYAHDDETQYYAIDQLPEVFRQYGFEYGQEQFVENTFSADARRLNRLRFDNLVFVAERQQ